LILSDGVLVKAPRILWEGTTSTWPGWGNWSGTADTYSASYAQMYREQVWIATVVNKLAMGTARLPLKVYIRDDMNRPEAADSPYAQLLAKPNNRYSRFYFWLWLSSTFDVYGEAFAAKIRDPGGRPTQLALLHPTCMYEEKEVRGETRWTFRNNNVEIKNIRDRDLVHPKTYNPDSTTRGLSRLEPLRRTLEFEDSAQRSQSAFWRKGARPGVALSHPGTLSQPAQDRLKMSWDKVASGPDNTGATVVLEEGMKPEILTIPADKAQYEASRKLNREEVCGAYDVPPPAVHILDRATFSNITEQMRSIYRDSQAPRLKLFEECLELELRSSLNPKTGEPDFGDQFYAEFLLDEVLRGDFEARATAYQQADYMTIAEKRRAENLPFIDGTDQILVNAAQLPLDQIDEEPLPDNVVPLPVAAAYADDPVVKRLMGTAQGTALALEKRLAELGASDD
jgi:HK97 family phage portal protein